MNSLTMLLANQSTRRLDDFGLSVEEVTKRQAELEEQGLSTQQAFKTAVYDTAAQKLTILGDTSQLAATKIARTERGLTDTKNALAEMATAVLSASGALDATSSWATNTSDAANAIREHGFSIKAWALAADAYMRTGDQTEAIGKFVEVTESATTNTSLWGKAIAANQPLFEAMGKTIAATIDPSKALEAGEAWVDMWNKVFGVGQETEAAATAISGYNGYVVASTAAADGFTASLEAEAAAVLATT